MAKQFESSYSKWQKKSVVSFDKTKLDLNLEMSMAHYLKLPEKPLRLQRQSDYGRQ